MRNLDNKATLGFSVFSKSGDDSFFRGVALVVGEPVLWDDVPRFLGNALMGSALYSLYNHY